MMDGQAIQSVFAIDQLTKFVSLVDRGHMFDNLDLRQWFKVKQSPHLGTTREHIYVGR